MKADSGKINARRKTVFITGATSGIGQQIAVAFARQGWDLICHYHRSSQKLKELLRIARKHNVNCEFIRADFVSPGQLKSLQGQIKRWKIDSLINNAGTYISQKHFSRLDLEEIEETFMVNFFSALLISSEAFSNMKKRNFGRIVNISSIAAKYGGSGTSLAYGCSKCALEGLTKTLAKEGAANNILVNTVRPGFIDTDFHKKFPKDINRRIQMIPLRRIGAPAEVADLVYYLGSERNTFITNETIAVSGGE